MEGEEWEQELFTLLSGGELSLAFTMAGHSQLLALVLETSSQVVKLAILDTGNLSRVEAKMTALALVEKLLLGLQLARMWKEFEYPWLKLPWSVNDSSETGELTSLSGSNFGYTFPYPIVRILASLKRVLANLLFT